MYCTNNSEDAKVQEARKKLMMSRRNVEVRGYYKFAVLFLDIINNASACPCEGIVTLIPIPEAAPFRNPGNGRI